MQERWWNRENRQLIRRYFNTFRPYRKANRPLAVKAALGTLIATSVSLILPWVTMKAVDQLITTRNTELLAYLLAAWVAAILIRTLANYLTFYHLMLFRKRMTITGQLKLMRQLLLLPTDYFNKTNVGYAVCRVRDDVSAMTPFWIDTHISLVQSVVTVVVSSILLFSISRPLTGVLLVLSPFYLATSFIMMKTIRRLSWDVRESAGLAEGKLHEAFSGATTVKLLGLEMRAIAAYFSRAKVTIRKSVRLEVISRLVGSLSGVLRSLVPVVIFCYAGYLIYQDRLSIGEFIGFSAYVSFLLEPLSSLFGFNGQLQRGLAPLQRLFEILDMKTESPSIVKGIENGQKLRGKITFHDVSFSYDNVRPVLSEMCIHIEVGSKVGICGVSGAGKSTFVNLLLGLYSPSAGCIRFDDRLASEFPIAAIRRSIGIVSQDIFLFNSTVRENISCGSRHVSTGDLECAAKAAGVHEFVSAMPQGYDTPVGVRGMKLSGGERARLSIARAILRKPSILILDEATSQLDSKTEQALRDATRELFRHCTVITIAHRISSITEADLILVFEGGRVVQQGQHEVLRKIPGLYRRLYLAQAMQDGEWSDPENGGAPGSVSVTTGSGRTIE